MPALKKAAVAAKNGRLPVDELPESLPEVGQEIRVELPELVVHELRTTLIGTSPLVVHRRGSKMTKQIWGKQRQEAKTGRQKKNPVEDFLDTLILIDQRERDHLIAVDANGKPVKDYDGELENPIDIFAKIDVEGGGSGFGFPAHALREAMISVGGLSGLAFKTDMRRLLMVPMTFFLVESDTAPRMRFDHAPVQRLADLRFRAQFDTWRVQVSVSYVPSLISDAQVLNLMRLAGRFVGFGEMRPEKKVGSFGTFAFDADDVTIKRIA